MADLTITAANVVAGSNAIKESGVAAAAVTAGQPVYKAADGRYGLADSNSGTVIARSPRGIALHAAAANQPLTIQRSGDIAIVGGLIAGMGQYHGLEEVDVSGKIVIPGLIDAHIHLESALVSPAEFARAVLPHGTTTVIADPHEIANVMGTDGIEYMLEATESLPIRESADAADAAAQHLPQGAVGAPGSDGNTAGQHADGDFSAR